MPDEQGVHPAAHLRAVLGLTFNLVDIAFQVSPERLQRRILKDLDSVRLSTIRNGSNTRASAQAAIQVMVISRKCLGVTS